MSHDKVIVLRNGYHYEIAEDNSKTQVFGFQNFRLPLIPKQIDSIGYRLKAASTLTLAASSAPADLAEFQWRLSTYTNTRDFANHVPLPGVGNLPRFLLPQSFLRFTTI